MKLGRLISIIRKTAVPTSDFHTTSFNWLLIVENCSKISTSIKKRKSTKYYFHSGCPGGLRTLTWKQLQLSTPEKLVELAFRRMFPRNAQSRLLMKKLRLHRTEILLKG